MKAFDRVALSVLLILLPACAARQAQQSINTLNEQFKLIASVVDSANLQAMDRCASAEGALRDVLTAQKVPNSARHVVEYIKVIEPVKEYMEKYFVTMETALAVVGDVPMPFTSHEESDPFNGCLIKPGKPYVKPIYVQSSNRSTDEWVFRWWPKDSDRIVLEMLNKSLPKNEQVMEVRWLVEAMQSMSNALDARAARGEVTLLKYIRAINEGEKFLVAQAKQLRMQLQQNLDLARAQDQATRQAIAAGVAAAAAAVAATSTAGYRGSQDSYQQQQLELQRQQLEVQQQILSQQQQAEYQRQSEERQRRTQRFEECMRNSSSANPKFCSP